MIINSISQNYLYSNRNKKNNNISFQYIADYRKGVAAYNYYNTSSFFRYRFDVGNYIRFLENMYKNIPHVNIISHACSDGEETFSILFKMIKMLGKKGLDKYSIEGRDFDALNILYAKKGSYTVSPAEIQKMEEECEPDLYKFIEICGHSDDSTFIKVKDSIRELVPFTKVDILKDKNIPSENTSLLIRNMWPYLPSKMQIQLADKLSKTLAPSSHIVLGEFDISNNVHHLLREFGFEHTEIFEIMKKPGFKTDDFDDARLLLNKFKARGQNKINSL